MSTIEKAQDLYDKGLSSFEEGNFNEALHYFNESIKLQPSPKVEDKIKECKEKIKEKKEKEKTSPQNSDENINSTQEKSEDEIECEKIIDEKDYYKLLNVIKQETIDPDELKKAYKKLAIKFHPDKNKAARADEAFKKISTAYQTLNDLEKRKLYDKYGTEEEFREKYYQANQQRYEEEDEYDIFDILFEGQGRRTRRRRYQYQQATPEQKRRMKYLSYLQIAFFLFFILYQYLPILFAKKPLYAFERDVEYKIMKKTARNKVVYYANDKFDSQFPNATVLIDEEINIELAYVEYTIQKCNERREMKTQFEYRLWYVPKGSSQYYFYIEQLKHLDFSICDIHTKLKNKLERGIGNEVIKDDEDKETEDEDDDEDEDEEKEKEDKSNKKKKDKASKSTISKASIEEHNEEEEEDDDDV